MAKVKELGSDWLGDQHINDVNAGLESKVPNMQNEDLILSMYGMIENMSKDISAMTSVVANMNERVGKLENKCEQIACMVANNGKGRLITTQIKASSDKSALTKHFFPKLMQGVILSVIKGLSTTVEESDDYVFEFCSIFFKNSMTGQSKIASRHSSALSSYMYRRDGSDIANFVLTSSVVCSILSTKPELSSIINSMIKCLRERLLHFFSLNSAKLLARIAYIDHKGVHLSESDGNKYLRNRIELYRAGSTVFSAGFKKLASKINPFERPKNFVALLREYKKGNISDDGVIMRSKVSERNMGNIRSTTHIKLTTMNNPPPQPKERTNKLKGLGKSRPTPQQSAQIRRNRLLGSTKQTTQTQTQQLVNSNLTSQRNESDLDPNDAISLGGLSKFIED
ncbi:MAG: hypothetical protein AAFY41_00615 [Bacteroidota bacterium]